jgi:hypothetical protein
VDRHGDMEPILGFWQDSPYGGALGRVGVCCRRRHRRLEVAPEVQLPGRRRHDSDAQKIAVAGGFTHPAWPTKIVTAKIVPALLQSFDRPERARASAGEVRCDRGSLENAAACERGADCDSRLASERNLFAIEIPRLGSFIASGNWTAREIGLEIPFQRRLTI